MSPREVVLSLREKVLMDFERAMSDLCAQPAEHGPNDLRAARLLLIDLHLLFTKRGEKEKAAACLQCAQFITAELR